MARPKSVYGEYRTNGISSKEEPYYLSGALCTVIAFAMIVGIVSSPMWFPVVSTWLKHLV